MSRVAPNPETAFPVGQPKGRKSGRNKVERHLAWIRKLPCVVTGQEHGVEAAHVRYGDRRYGKRETGMGEKPSDCYVVPLHYQKHNWGPDSQHANGERGWWKKQGIDPLRVAVSLWAATGDDAAGREIIREARNG